MAHQLPGDPGGLPCGEMLVENKRGVSRLDNTSAVSYINMLGRTVSARLTAIVKELWLWCKNRDITLIAEHLPAES